MCGRLFLTVSYPTYRGHPDRHLCHVSTFQLARSRRSGQFLCWLEWSRLPHLSLAGRRAHPKEPNVYPDLFSHCYSPGIEDGTLTLPAPSMSRKESSKLLLRCHSRACSAVAIDASSPPVTGVDYRAGQWSCTYYLFPQVVFPAGPDCRMSPVLEFSRKG
jgi:hypothetical protein